MEEDLPFPSLLDLLRRTVSNSAAAFCMIIVMLPFFLHAMYERHGQPSEVVAGQVIRCMFLRTKERPYQTNISTQPWSGRLRRKRR